MKEFLIFSLRFQMDGIELKYQGKRSESEIISLVSDVKKIKLGKNPTYINGDNLIVMSSLLASGYNNSVDLIYIDPPYNTNQVFSVDNDRVSTISRNGSVVAYSDNLRPSVVLRQDLVQVKMRFSSS